MRAKCLLAAALLLLSAPACNQEFDPDDRRSATQDEYALTEQSCELVGDRAVARGRLKSHAGESQEFAIVVRWFDGEVDLGRPQTVERDEPLADGDTWPWEATLTVDEPPADLRCDVIQVVIGDDV